MPKKFYSKEQVDLLVSEIKDSIPVIETGNFNTYEYERNRKHIESSNSHKGRLTVSESFSKEFNTKPEVFFTPLAVDISHGNHGSIRYAFENLEVNEKEFTVDVVTWDNSKIWNLKIKWLAIGK